MNRISLLLFSHIFYSLILALYTPFLMSRSHEDYGYQFVAEFFLGFWKKKLKTIENNPMSEGRGASYSFSTHQ